MANKNARERFGAQKRAGGTEQLMGNITKQHSEFQDQKVLFLAPIRVSRWTYDRLCKIQAAKGIPLEIWAESELIESIHREWNFEENRPRRDTDHG